MVTIRLSISSEAAYMNIPRTMQAAVLVEQHTPLEIHDIELPSELGIGQVLVKVHYSGICGSQLGEIEGVKGPDKFLPHLLGHEGAGTVLAVGAGVDTVTPDDVVVLHWRPSPGIQSKPPIYKCAGRHINAGWITTFNEHAIVSENRLTAISSGTDMKIAALFGCAVTTGFGVIVNDAHLTIGESVVVYGAGGVGLNVVQAAALVSAYPIIAVDLHDKRLDLAREMGATHVINGRGRDAFADIRRIVGDVGLDCFIDNTGKSEVIESGYEAVRFDGRVILVGVPRSGNNINVHSLPMHFGKQFKGSHGGSADPAADIPRYMNLMRNSRLRLDSLVTDVVPLEQINDAIGGMRDGSINGRCLIGFD